MKFITLDPYYPKTFYLEAKSALKNNKINFEEFVYIKAPFDFYFGVDDNLQPLFVNYDVLPNADNRWLVSTVIPLKPVEYYNLTRRNDDTGYTAIERFILNEPLREAMSSEYCCFFNLPSLEETREISRFIPTKIWYFGKYFHNKYRLGLTCNEYIKDFILSENILLEKTKQQFKKAGSFEAELNYKVFLQTEKLKKYSQTHYIQNGVYHKPDIFTYSPLV